MSDIIEGRNPVVEALRAGRPLNKLLLARSIGHHPVIGEIISLCRSQKVPVEYVDRQFMDRLTTTSAHQGVIAYAASKEYLGLEDLLADSAGKNELPLYCVLDGIEDPQNLGAILRTALASGANGVVIRARRAVGLTASVARASAGAVEHVPVARVVNIAQAIVALQKSGVWVVGIDQAASVPYYQIDFKPSTAIVIGSEGGGLSALVKKRCDALASIPMRGKISSLNASVAAALVMYEAFKQRGWGSAVR